MRTIKGIPVSSGVVIGRVFVIDEGQPRRVVRREVDPADVPAELERFDLARRAAIEELNALHKEAADEMGEEAAKIFLFHIGALSDKAVLGPIRRMIEQERVAAEYACTISLRTLAERFANHPDSTFRTKVSDITDLGARLVGILTGREQQRLSHIEPNTVIVARDLTPSQTAGFDRSKVIAIATDFGGQTSHTAIVARALGLPAVVGLRELTLHARDGQAIVVDSERGQVMLDPDEATLAEAGRDAERAKRSRITLEEGVGLPALTTDGVAIELLGNIEFPTEIPAVLNGGGVGVGLYRTEFLYLTSDHEPTEEEQTREYIDCVKRLGGLPLTIRTLDLGADKYTQQRAETPERNPFLGLRSIRYSLRNTEMFRRQLRAILRASAHGPVRVMFPLVTNIAEFRRAKYFLHESMEDLDESKEAYDREISVGMMVEVPAAALMASSFAREVDFFSIGTNDLVQYTLAVDRINEQVAGLYTPVHPAVLKLIRDVSRVAARAKLPVSCCGESASDPAFAALLIGLGVRSLSVTASSLPRLRMAVRGLDSKRCERIAKRAMSFDSETETAAYVRDRIRKLVPEVFDGRSAE
ncbi:MAG: phosphoenolpyruvate--protein phosphotransferase [Phycisphaerales bacterium]|nr:phosphoenolpyruvate--protein phosphotransferase [Planctomycetota bacterium]MCH8508144.1 phosphoenolpyruvate--protein phosphotransferase [Phycisphaerales bacterium]